MFKKSTVETIEVALLTSVGRTAACASTVQACFASPPVCIQLHVAFEFTALLVYMQVCLVFEEMCIFKHAVDDLAQVAAAQLLATLLDPKRGLDTKPYVPKVMRALTACLADSSPAVRKGVWEGKEGVGGVGGVGGGGGGGGGRGQKVMVV